jgi:hypothetical protein
MTVASLALVLAGTLLAQTGTSTLSAERRVEEAKKYFDAGRQAYEAGDYLAAAEAFQQAQTYAPRTAIIFSIAQAYRQQFFIDRDPANLRRAVTHYSEYLNQVPKGGRRIDALRLRAELQQQLARVEAGTPLASITPSEVRTQLMVTSRTPGAEVKIDDGEAQEAPLIQEVTPGKHAIIVMADGYIDSEMTGVAVERRLVVVAVDLLPRPATIHLSAPDGADIALDGRPLGQAPLLRPIQTNAGDHYVAVTDRGRHPFVRELQLDKGDDVTVTANLEQTSQRDVSFYMLGGSAIFFGATVATVIIALGSEAHARFLLTKLDRGMNLTILERDMYNDDRSRRGDMITVSSVFLATSIGLGVTGGLLFFLDVPSVQSGTGVTKTEASKTTAIAPLIDAHTLGAQVSGSF